MDLLFGGSHKRGDRRVKLHEFCAPDERTFQRLAEVFENSAVLLADYSDGTLNQAFWDLGSNVWWALGEDSIPWNLRQRVIISFASLFRDLFANRCSPVLRGHGSPLNSACYMWWDFDCWRSTLTSALLPVMRSILAIDHIACQESSLHGLGHWYHRQQREAVERIIDEYLEREPHIPAELRKYAYWARQGCVQ